jgi:hypothetical protein
VDAFRRQKAELDTTKAVRETMLRESHRLTNSHLRSKKDRHRAAVHALNQLLQMSEEARAPGGTGGSTACSSRAV